MKVPLKEKDMDCLISVIVPVYKVEKYIHRCVDSILAQTFTDFELVLVDDGSPDNCGKICDEYALKDNRIHVIHKENGGLSDARNAGIDWALENSNSEWLTFIDSDDWVHPKYFEAMVRAAQIYRTEIAICNYIEAETFTDFESLPKLDICVANTEDFFVSKNTVATVAWGKIYKKSYFQKTRYPFGKLNEDEFVTYKLLFQNQKLAFVQNPMYFYFQNTSGIMNSTWNPKKLDALEALEEQFRYFKNSPYNAAFESVVNKYIWFLKENYDYLQDYKGYDKKESTVKQIRKNMRKCLRKKCIDKPIEKNEQLYTIAYPRLINCYYLKKRIKKKIKRIVAR